ncbi:hypothetical protein BOX15_Mlig020211g4 [Macrostomum lignano]|uniref:THAP-type domain-containing protein n=1 Tax=Macrostomum lignano TaxID=282301 RepID=A0A267H1C6_9PLAT|nr:hypothetical protein BOX15_Mlig020211g4 [Macrostomum lignano]
MPNKCAVFGCKSSRESATARSARISFHKFPNRDDLLEKWLRSISREATFKPSKHTRICSLYCTESDFIAENQDSNAYRKKKQHVEGANLVKRILREDAVPTQYSTTSMTSYFTKTPLASRSGNASCRNGVTRSMSHK